MSGVSPKHFLAGGMPREEATSAFLATLIEQSPEFCGRLFKLCKIPAFDILKVAVEQERKDVTVFGENVFVIIENKIASSAKMDGQLLGYYEQVRNDNPDAIIHALYLGPNRHLGESEIAMVTVGSGAVKKCLSWSDDIRPLCQSLKDFDNVFAEQGIQHVLDAIHRRRDGPDWSEDQQIVNKIFHSIVRRLRTTSLDFERYWVEGMELGARGLISVVANCTKIIGKQSEKEVCWDLRFRLASSYKLSSINKEDRPNAKRWIKHQKTIGDWQGFKTDTGGNWMVKKCTCALSELEQKLLCDFQKLVNTIDQCIASEHNSVD